MKNEKKSELLFTVTGNARGIMLYFSWLYDKFILLLINILYARFIHRQWIKYAD